MANTTSQDINATLVRDLGIPNSVQAALNIIQTEIGNLPQEAPIDGNIYGRKDAAWSNIGTYIDTIFTEGNNEYYVSSFSGNDTNSGSLAFPFATVQQGINAVITTGNAGTIYLDGVFTEDVVISDAINNIRIVGKSTLYNGPTIDTSNTLIKGHCVISGSSSSVYIQGVSFAPEDAASPVIFVNTNGDILLYLKDMQIQDDGNGTVLTMTSPDTGINSVLILDNIQQVGGIINLEDYSVSSGTMLFFNTLIGPNTYVGSNWEVIIATASAFNASWSGNISNIIMQISGPSMNISTMSGDLTLSSSNNINLLTNNGGGGGAVIVNSGDLDLTSNTLRVNNVTVSSGTTFNLNFSGPNGINGFTFDDTDGQEQSKWMNSDLQAFFVDPRYNIDQNPYMGIGGSFSLSNRPKVKLDVDGDVGVPNNKSMSFGDPTVDGSWRLIPNGPDQFYVQNLIGGIWTTKFSAPNSSCSYGPIANAPTNSAVTLDGYVVKYTTNAVGTSLFISQVSGTSSGQVFASNSTSTVTVNNPITVTTTPIGLASISLSATGASSFIQYFCTFSSNNSYMIYMHYNNTTTNLAISMTRTS